MNKFIVTGIPRSGTTIFTKTLAQQSGVDVFSNDHFFYEPFSMGFKNKFRLNPEKDLAIQESKCKDDYFGFKAFKDGFLTPDYLMTQGYRPIVLLRKDLWKSVISAFVQQWQVGQNLHPTYTSKEIIFPDVYNTVEEVPPFMRTRFLINLGNRVMMCYRAERVWKDVIDIIYFEDLIKPGATFKNVNEYFQREIKFDLNYDNSMDALDYVPGIPREWFTKITREVIQKLEIETPDIPQYIIDSVNRYL